MKYFFYLYILFILAIGFVPVFGSIDKAAVQWVYLSVLLLIGFVFLFFKKDITIQYHQDIISIRLYFIFILLAIFSLLYTNNVINSIHELSHLFTLLVLLIFVVNIFFTNNFKFHYIALIFLIVAFFESLYSLSPLFYSIYKDGFLFTKASSINVDIFKGVAGNRNITTASLIVKAPFAFYLMYHYSGLKRVLLLICSVFILLPVFLITSRAALVSLSFLFLFNFLLFIKPSFFKVNYLSGISVFFSFLISYLLSVFILPSENSNSLERISGIEISNESSSNRFELWSNALDHISNNLFISSGIGNWKIDSAAYWGSLGADYLVPYHAHNDFLHYAAELGIIGGLIYLFIFLSLFYLCFLFFKKSLLISFTIFSSLFAYFIDSSLNFPYDRPVMQVTFIILIALTCFHYKVYKDAK